MAHPATPSISPTGTSNIPPLPRHAAVRNAVEASRPLDASRWMIKNFLDWSQILLSRRPTFQRARAYPIAAADVAFAEAEMERCVANGYRTDVRGMGKERPHEIVSGIVTWSAGKQRFVIDCRHRNQKTFIEERTIKYEGLLDSAQLLKPREQLMGWDVKDVHHHVPRREAEKPLFCFKCLGRVFLCIKMLFGLNVARYLCTKACCPVVQQLRAVGFRIVVHVDDFVGAAP